MYTDQFFSPAEGKRSRLEGGGTQKVVVCLSGSLTARECFQNSLWLPIGWKVVGILVDIFSKIAFYMGELTRTAAILLIHCEFPLINTYVGGVCIEVQGINLEKPAEEVIMTTSWIAHRNSFFLSAENTKYFNEFDNFVKIPVEFQRRKFHNFWPKTSM